MPKQQPKRKPKLTKKKVYWALVNSYWKEWEWPDMFQNHPTNIRAIDGSPFVLSIFNSRKDAQIMKNDVGLKHTKHITIIPVHITPSTSSTKKVV